MKSHDGYDYDCDRGYDCGRDDEVDENVRDDDDDGNVVFCRRAYRYTCLHKQKNIKFRIKSYETSPCHGVSNCPSVTEKEGAGR